jgi:stearoyl-CoA desaturase (delta-9 desaturase)
LHIGAIAALFTFSWMNLSVALFLLWFATGLGISMGYHWLHAHRSYRVPIALEYLFAVCGALTLEGGPISWVATHRLHHRTSDMPGDPHSPRDGGWWAHTGWILSRAAGHHELRLLVKHAPDLAKHRFYVRLNAYHWLPNVLLAGLLAAVGGLPMMLWGFVCGPWSACTQHGS